jgi:cysteinyl-tRNA synthetase
VSELRLYNTLTRRKEAFSPREPGRVRLFTCGPSVYRPQHLGNYRTYLFEDVLHRYLVYRGLQVDRLLNFTDVEDKAIAEARDKGVTLEALRRPVEEAFLQECGLLGIRLPPKIPRATTSVESAVALVQRLIQRGHAYWQQGEVFFDPLTYDGFGRLFGLDMSRWPRKKVRFRKDTYPGRRWNRGDFILWHKRTAQDGDVWWDTEIGEGRPAWNIQDAAMIHKHLGPEIDIHTGGVDNLYRHHDYTLAIMEGASGKRFCPWWLHGAPLMVDGEKMSKSRGNIAYLDDLLARGFEARHLRFFLLYAPYREPLDLRIARLEQRAGLLDRVRRQASRLRSKGDVGGTGDVPGAGDEPFADDEPFAGDASRTGDDPGAGHDPGGDAGAGPERGGGSPADELRAAFQERMDDNLDYAGAFDALRGHVARAVAADRHQRLDPRERAEICAALVDVDRVLNVLGCA